MRRYKIPNTGTLVAFEASARHGSFTQAAKELALTESAVSRQIGTLEENLGVRLFVRSNQRVVLTRAGTLYANQIRRSLESLDRDTLSIIAHGTGGGCLELAVLPTFASHWLIPRLKDFYERTRDVQINMGVRTETFSFENSHYEAAIHYGRPIWPGASSDYLFGEEVIPVCSPTLLAKPVKKASDLLKYPLLHSTTRPYAWAKWFFEQGIDDNSTMQGVRYELHTMLIAAASAALGIALVPTFFLEGKLHQLGLVTPFQATSTVDSAYYIVYPTELSHGKPLELFRGWLLAQAAAYIAAGSGGVRK